MTIATLGGIDCDLHPAVPGIAALIPYLDPQWADAVSQCGVHDLESTSYPLRADLVATGLAYRRRQGGLQSRAALHAGARRFWQPRRHPELPLCGDDAVQ